LNCPLAPSGLITRLRQSELDFVHYVMPALAPASHNGQSQRQRAAAIACAI